MHVEIELDGFGEASKLLCESCPLLYSDEYTPECSLDYHLGRMTGRYNGWANYDTGEVILGIAKRRGRPLKYGTRMDRYKHSGSGWHLAIVRPKECIDAHGL